MRQKVLCLVLILGVLPSCAHMTDRQRTQTEGAALGTGTGAILGGVLGYLAGGKDGAIAGAAIGGVVGVTAGHEAGRHIANKKEAYASREAYLDDVLKGIRTTNEVLQQTNMRWAQDIEKLKIETFLLMRQYRQDKSRYRAVQAKHQEVEGELSKRHQVLEWAEEQVSREKARLQYERKNLRSAQEKSLVYMRDPEIRQLENHRDELEQKLREFESIKDRLRV
jgi:hypothetical protein